MNPSDLKLGAVYQYVNMGDDLYLVVRLLDRKPGAHEWLCLTGPDAGFLGLESDPLTYGWEHYRLVEEGP